MLGERFDAGTIFGSARGHGSIIAVGADRVASKREPFGSFAELS